MNVGRSLAVLHALTTDSQMSCRQLGSVAMCAPSLWYFCMSIPISVHLTRTRRSTWQSAIRSAQVIQRRPNELLTTLPTPTSRASEGARRRFYDDPPTCACHRNCLFPLIMPRSKNLLSRRLLSAMVHATIASSRR